MSPMIAVAETSRGLLTFQRNSRLPIATSAVSRSPIAIYPSRTQSAENRADRGGVWGARLPAAKSRRALDEVIGAWVGGA
jgi:hypothetical protein